LICVIDAVAGHDHRGPADFGTMRNVATEQLRGAAFGARPDIAVTGARGSGDAEWLAAVVLGGQGWYAAAATRLRDLRPRAGPVLSALAASTLAAHRRQVGGHDAARVLDAAALRRLAAAGPSGAGIAGASIDPAGLDPADPDGADAAGARSDALLGLAADALGVGRTAVARRLLAIADGLGGGWRAQVRRRWVRAEIALADGRADAAVAPAESALRRAEAAGAVRHQVKSEMVLAAALATAGGDQRRARRLAAGAFDRATELGLLPLAWPCALLLADLDPANAAGHLARAGHALYSVLRRCDPVARRLALASPLVPTWLAEHDQHNPAGIWLNSFTDLPPDRVKVGPEASDR